MEKYISKKKVSDITNEFNESLKLFESTKKGIVFFGGSHVAENNKYYIDAKKLAAKLSKIGENIITGGGPGIMEAANCGAMEGKGLSIGLNINIEIREDKNCCANISYKFDNFSVRKANFVNLAKIFVVFPGGFGTLDELFEVLTLIQTQKIENKFVILYGKFFWTPLLEWMTNHLIKQGLLTKKHIGFLKIVDSVDEVYDLTCNKLCDRIKKR